MKVENKRLKEERKEKEQYKVNLKLELLETKKKLDISQDMNERLMKDIQVINNKLMVFVPGAIEKDNEELKETISMLHAVIDRTSITLIKVIQLISLGVPMLPVLIIRNTYSILPI